MGFIYGLRLKNFRIFENEQEFIFSPITVLTGANSSGKSTLSHSLRLINTIFKKNFIKRNFDNEGFKSIDLYELFKKISYDRIDKRISEFKNFINRYSNSNIMEIGFPLIIEDYPNPVEIKFIYENINEIVSFGRLNEFAVIDVQLNIELFKIYNKDGEIYAKVNYKHFYNILEQEQNSLKNLNEELNIYLKNKDIGINDLKLKNELKDKVKNLFGDIEIKIGKKENDNIGFIYPYIFDTVGIESNFDWSKKSVEKKFRTFHTLSEEYNNRESLIDISKFSTESMNRIFDAVNQKNEKINTYLNNLIIENLSNYEIKLGKIELDELAYSYLNSEEKLFQPSLTVVDILKEKNLFLNENNEENLTFENLDSYYKLNILTKFGSNFFSKYVMSRIYSAISKIEISSFFDNEEYQFSSRTLNIHDNKTISNEVINFSNSALPFKIFVTKWIEKFGIGNNISIQTLENTFSLNLINNNNIFNILDEGYGTSKIIPLLIKIFNVCASKYDANFPWKESNILVLEEPEIGLHPKLQSLLADMFIDAYKELNIQFIIETHSEYLIRKLQVLTVQKEIKTTDTQLYYFFHPNKIPEGEVQCYPINIDEDGSLSKNFGIGFFDESSNLNVALYIYSRENKN